MTTRFADHLLEGDHASRPAFGDVPQGTLYACSTHALIYQSDGVAAWATWATLGGAAPNAEDVPFTPAGTIAATDVQAAIEEVASEATGGGAADDPILAAFGAPTTEYDFETSSLAGWTARGAPDVVNADTTAPGCYYVKHNTSTTQLFGHYRASPSMPFTLIAKVMDGVIYNTNISWTGAVFVGEATPGKLAFCSYRHATGWKPGASYWSSPTSGAAADAPGTVLVTEVSFPHYLALVVNSSTDIAAYLSKNGRVWDRRASAWNPGFTVGAIGVGAVCEGYKAITAIDFLRVWNSALTFPFVNT